MHLNVPNDVETLQSKVTKKLERNMVTFVIYECKECSSWWALFLCLIHTTAACSISDSKFIHVASEIKDPRKLKKFFNATFCFCQPLTHFCASLKSIFLLPHCTYFYHPASTLDPTHRFVVSIWKWSLLYTATRLFDLSLLHFALNFTYVQR